MSKPGHTPSPPPNQQDPLLAAPTAPLPFRAHPLPLPLPLAIPTSHPSRLRRRFESRTRDGADPVRETLIVPESAIFENEPAAGMAEAAPAFALGTVVADVEGRVEIA